MDDLLIIEQAKNLPDSDTNLTPFFGDSSALQIRIDALVRSGNFNAKKALYVIKNVEVANIYFPLSLVGQIYTQAGFDQTKGQEKLDFLARFFKEDVQTVEREIALSRIGDDPLNNGSTPSANLDKQAQLIFDFELIARNLSSLTKIANPLWRNWLQAVTAVHVLRQDEGEQSEQLEILGKEIRETLDLLDNNSRDELNRKLSKTIFHTHKGEGDEALSAMISFASRIGLFEPERNILWQVIQSSSHRIYIELFTSFFDEESPNTFANFVLSQVKNAPYSNSNGYLGSTLSEILESPGVKPVFKDAIINELGTIRRNFDADLHSEQDDFKAIDSTIKGLIYNLVKTKRFPETDETYKHVAASREIIDRIVEEFGREYIQEIIDARLVSPEKGIELIAGNLGVDPVAVEWLTSSPNGIELLDSLREYRTGQPSKMTTLQKQRTDFQSDASRSWSTR